MNLTLCNETDKRRNEFFAFEIYKMINLPINAYNQFFKIMIVRFIRSICDF